MERKPHDCSPASLFGAFQAHAQVDQSPIFNPENILNGSFEAQINFPKVVNRLADKQASVNISKYVKNNQNGFVEALDTTKSVIDMARTPEALLPKAVFGKIDKKMTQWSNYYNRTQRPKLEALESKWNKAIKQIKDPAKVKAAEAAKDKAMAPLRKEAATSYRNMVGKQFTAAKGQIQSVFDTNAENPKKLIAELQKMGLSPKDASYAHQYLGYLENGGPYFNFNPGGGSRMASTLSEMVSNLTRNKVSYNALTVGLHTAGIAQRAPAVFGFTHTLNGTIEAAIAAKNEGVNLLQHIPSLAKEGVYSSDMGPLIPDGKFDPLHVAQTLSDNLGYFIGKQVGDPMRGVKEIAYRPKPWNDTVAFQDPTGRNFLQFMSFHFRHVQQYGGWIRDAVAPASSPAVRVNAARALAAYSLVSAAIFGDKAAIPEPVLLILHAADPNFTKDLHNLNHQIPLIGDFADKGIVGEATGLDLGEKAAPLGGLAVGIGSDMLNSAVQNAPKALKAVKEVREGHPGKAAAVAVNATVAISQIFKGGANAAVQKAVDGITQAYLHDQDFPNTLKTVTEKEFGKGSVIQK